MKILELFDIGTEMGMLTQLRVHKIAQFLCDFGVTEPGDPLQIPLELLGFKDPVFIQQSPLSWPWHPLSPV